MRQDWVAKVGAILLSALLAMLSFSSFARAEGSAGASELEMKSER